MFRVLWVVATLALFCLPAASQSEAPTVVGKMAELILKYGDISETECGKKYKRPDPIEAPSNLNTEWYEPPASARRHLTTPTSLMRSF